jgi:hypothetical protein
MSDVRIYKASFLRNLYWYIKRKITNTGPHGKYCGCKKWGYGHIGLGCPIPTYKLTVHESITDKK